jgi:hypothetical protein
MTTSSGAFSFSNLCEAIDQEYHLIHVQDLAIYRELRIRRMRTYYSLAAFEAGHY